MKLKRIINKIGKFIWHNKRNAGILAYYTARVLFPDFVQEYGFDLMYISDILLGTGFAHNVVSTINKNKLKK